MHRAWHACPELPARSQGATELGICTLGGPCPKDLQLGHQKVALATDSPNQGPFYSLLPPTALPLNTEVLSAPSKEEGSAAAGEFW